MTINVLKDTKSEIFLIFEHKAEFSVILYLLLFFKRKPVFFFVHDMQQVATLKLRSQIALQICRAWVRLGEFYPVFISLDDSGLNSNQQFSKRKKLTIPHPHHLADRPLRHSPRPSGARLRIGIIETMKKEKAINRLLEVLQREQKTLNFQLVIGLPVKERPSSLNGLNVEIVDTSTESLFSQYLEGLDIFVADYVKKEYYFRPSGVLVDAGMNGCYVICPDFPVFRAQIKEPTPIGSTFSNLDELPEVLREGIETVQSKRPDFDTWRRYHQIENIAGQFKTFLEQQNM